MPHVIRHIPVITPARNLSPERELFKAWSVVGIRDGLPREIVACRVWGARRGTSRYASVWIKAGDWDSGHGVSRGGPGFEHTGAAVAKAIERAGYTLDEDCHGQGDSSIVEALEALARFHGYTDVVTIYHA